MAYELISYPSDDALAIAAAEQWLKALAKRQDRVTPYTVALSGGRVAQKFFAAVAAKGKANLEWFINVHFFWADERCVAPDHADSNYRVAEADLFQPLKIPAFQIHRLRGEMEPVAGANHAIRELQEIAGNATGSLPQLDLVFLGMGEDGHVASLFPGDKDPSNPAWVRPVIGPKPPPQRLTMGYGLIANAKEVWVLASGKAKEQALKDSLSGPDKTPLGKVLAARKQTTILSDITVA
ncbi:MAG TPA: 6-phosphogluconolactonase [Verrucomicrobiae bacterium]